MGNRSQNYGTSRAIIYVITQPPDIGELASPQPHSDKPVLDLLTPEGWKVELTVCEQASADSHLSN